MKKELGDPENLDGFEELPEEEQERLRKAWDAGHVAEEDVPPTADKTKVIPGYVYADESERPKKVGHRLYQKSHRLTWKLVDGSGSGQRRRGEA